VVVRRADGIWQVMGARADGLTAPVRGIADGPLVLGVVGSPFGQRGLVDVRALDGSQVLPQPDTIGVTTPRWGRAFVISPEEYDAAASVAPLVAADAQVGVLASRGVPGSRAVIAEVSAPGQAEPSLLLAVSEPGNVFSGPPPVLRDGVVAGVVPRRDGRTLVLAGSSPTVARVEVRAPDGRVLVEGSGSASVVLPAPAPRSVQVRGFGADGQVVARLAVAVPGGTDDTGAAGSGAAAGG
jgi:hypothetical protein